MNTLRIFGLGSSHNFAVDVAKVAAASRFQDANRVQKRKVQAMASVCPKGMQGRLNIHHEERRPDGEAYTTSLDNVRGCDVFVISSLYSDEIESVDEKFMKAAIFINTLRNASASRITLVCPYICYSRQDRKTESRAPIATQAVAMMLEAAGVNRILTMDVHNLGAEQNAFRIPIDNLEGRKLLADVITKDIRFPGYAVTDSTDSDRQFKVLSPDAGGVGRTKAMQHSLSRRLGENVGIVYADKSRVNADTVKVQIIGDVYKRNIIIVDDMISTAGTVYEIKQAVEKEGGTLWAVVATHGLYVNGAPDKMLGIPRIYTTDTVAPFRLTGSKSMEAVRMVSTAPMFAEAIRRIHLEGGSISELLDD